MSLESKVSKWAAVLVLLMVSRVRFGVSRSQPSGSRKVREARRVEP